jgi:hypothetical protein
VLQVVWVPKLAARAITWSYRPQDLASPTNRAQVSSMLWGAPGREGGREEGREGGESPQQHTGHAGVRVRHCCCHGAVVRFLPTPGVHWMACHAVHGVVTYRWECWAAPCLPGCTMLLLSPPCHDVNTLVLAS